MPLLSILLVTFGHLSQDKQIFIYSNITFKRHFLKKKRLIKNRKTMLMIPKLIIFLLVLSEDFQDRNQYTNKMNDREFFTLEYISISNTVKNDFMTHQYQLYALSNLKYRNHKSFCRYLLLLSGDVEPNPGPGNSCTVCEKKMALRHRVLCCK